MNYLYGLAALALLLLGAEQYGEHLVQVEWDLERARNAVVAGQNARMNKAARAADKVQHKKDIENAKSQAGRRAITDWLRSHGMLPDGSPVCVTSGGQTERPSEPNGAADQPEPGGRIAEFAEGCALDALHVIRWQEWAVREGLEVSK